MPQDRRIIPQIGETYDVDLIAGLEWRFGRPRNVEPQAAILDEDSFRPLEGYGTLHAHPVFRSIVDCEGQQTADRSDGDRERVGRRRFLDTNFVCRGHCQPYSC